MIPLGCLGGSFEVIVISYKSAYRFMHQGLVLLCPMSDVGLLVHRLYLYSSTQEFAS
jgi:hypothetical protein